MIANIIYKFPQTRKEELVRRMFDRQFIDKNQHFAIHTDRQKKKKADILTALHIARAARER